MSVFLGGKLICFYLLCMQCMLMHALTCRLQRHGIVLNIFSQATCSTNLWAFGNFVSFVGFVNFVGCVNFVNFVSFVGFLV